MRGDGTAVGTLAIAAVALVAVVAVLAYVLLGGGAGPGAGDTFVVEVWYEEDGLRFEVVSVHPSLSAVQAAAFENDMPSGAHEVRLELWTVEGPTPHRVDKLAEVEYEVRTREDWGSGRHFATVLGGVDGVEFTQLGNARLSIVLFYDDDYDHSNIFTLKRDYSIHDQE